MSDKTRQAGIYALTLNGVVFYVGQSTDMKKRYAQHCSLSQNRSATKKSQWLRSLHELGISPDLQILECTEELDDREIAWIRHYRSLGEAKLNMSDGGQTMTYLRKKKSEKPWGTSHSPVQKIIKSMKETLRFMERHGYDDSAEHIKRRLVQVYAAIDRVGIDYLNMKMWEKYNGK